MMWLLEGLCLIPLSLLIVGIPYCRTGVVLLIYVRLSKKLTLYVSL